MRCCGRNSYAYELFRDFYLVEGFFFFYLLRIQTLTDAIAVTATTICVNKSKSSFVRTESTTHGTRAIQATHRYKWNVLDLSIIGWFFFFFLGEPVRHGNNNIDDHSQHTYAPIFFFSLIIFNFAWRILTAEYFTHCC